MTTWYLNRLLLPADNRRDRAAAAALLRVRIMEDGIVDRVQAEQIAIAQLDPGERLLWSGSPDPGRGALLALPITLFGIPFAGFAAFWILAASGITSHATRARGPWLFFPLFGLPFLLLGLGMLTAPLWAYLAARRMVYAVTEKRAIIIASGGVRGVQSYAHTDLGDIQRVERPDGSGDLYFATKSTVTSRGYVNQTKIGFTGIPEVRTVEQLVRGQLKQQAA